MNKSITPLPVVAEPASLPTPQNPSIAPRGDTSMDVMLHTSDARYKRIGLVIILVVFGGFGVWATVAPLSSATFATGVVQAEGYRTPVQHLEGGLVERIDVSNGEYVELGQPLIHLDDTAALADMRAVEVQLFGAVALLDRLIAERDDADQPVFSDILIEHRDIRRAAGEAMANEAALFEARREDRLGEIAVLEQRFVQLQQRLEALDTIQMARRATAASLEEEVTDLRELLEEGFVDKVRLRQLERTLDSTYADLASTLSDIGSTQVSIEETKLRISQLNKRFKTEVIAQLSRAAATVVDLEQRYLAIKERLERTVIRATETGTVLDLKVNAIGEVIRGGETLLEIVPDYEKLVVKAQISPADIDSVEVGDEAEIRFSAFKRVFTVTGKLTSLSADRLEDPATNMPYFAAEVDIYEEDLKLLGGRQILPGMPADILIEGDQRTLFQYLAKPVDNIFAKALIEE